MSVFGGILSAMKQIERLQK